MGLDLLPVIESAIEAGLATLKFYGTDLKIQIKDDASPLTQADLESNTIINNCLKDTQIPILSEENTNQPYEVRKHWKKLWIVDPLDGTKEFINARKEYTINIALVEDGRPVFGVIYAPVPDLLYWGVKGGGAFMIEDASENFSIEYWHKKALNLPITNKQDTISVVASKSHLSEDTSSFLQNLKERAEDVEILSYGSSLKMCKIAEGIAHLYPRLAPTMEWDTAAGQAIVECAGFRMVKYPSLDPLVYNKEELLNPWFISYNPDYQYLLR